MDRSWISITNKYDPRLIRGAYDFAKRAEAYVDGEGRIFCPCKKCVNARKNTPNMVASHIVHNLFDRTYKVWIHHGEQQPRDETVSENGDAEPNDGVDDLLHDAFPVVDEAEGRNVMDGAESADRHNNPNVEKLFVDMEKPLFPASIHFPY